MLTRSEGGGRLTISQSNDILISIITVVFRARCELLSVIESVERLKTSRMEFIVIDGDSDDGTRELLAEYDSVIDYWLSEPDMGIYDAMNKGIAAARGTFIFHLNAGDRLLHVPIRELEVAASNRTEVLAFRVSVDGENEFRPSRGLALRLKNTLHHQGTFFRRESFPGYDATYRVFADFDANQRLALRGAQIEIFDRVVSLHARGGVSDIASENAISEFFNIIGKNYGHAHILAAWFLCKWSGLIAKVSRWRRRNLTTRP